MLLCNMSPLRLLNISILPLLCRSYVLLKHMLHVIMSDLTKVYSLIFAQFEFILFIKLKFRSSHYAKILNIILTSN